MGFSFDLGPKPRLGYSAENLERMSERRGDAEFMGELERRGDARVYVLCGELVVLKRTGPDPQFRRDEAATLAPVHETVFLGASGGSPRFGWGIDPGAADGLKTNAGLLLIDLRSLAVQGLIGAEHLSPLAEAKAVLHWHARHRFCANCGAATRSVLVGWRRDCPACAAQHFPRTDPVVIMLAVDGGRCLLGRQTRFVSGMWSCLAGFVEPGETVEGAVRREIREEAGIVCGEVAYLASQPWPFPMSLMIGCHAAARSTNISIDRTELEDARWFTREEAAMMLARRHPERIATPPPVAIAYHLIRAWVEDARP